MTVITLGGLQRRVILHHIDGVLFISMFLLLLFRCFGDQIRNVNLILGWKENLAN